MYVLVVVYMYRLGIFRDEMNRRSNERRDPDRDRGFPPFHSVEPLPPLGRIDLDRGCGDNGV